MRVRIRLIQPPLVQPRYRQLTLPVVGAELAAAGLEVESCDENVQPLDTSPVELVGITCHVYNAPRAFDLARQFRARGSKVILGGTFPTVAPQLVAEHCDSVVVGELEGQAERIAADARAGRLQPLYRAATPPSLERTVRPDLSLTPAERYYRLNFPLEITRGCRFRCRFCTSQALYPTTRTRSLADVERDLAQYDHGLVEILDINFLDDRPAFERVLPVLKSAPIPGWTAQTTLLDLVDPALPDQLADARCRSIFVGLETLSEDGLKSVNKGWVKPQSFLEVSKRLRDAGILVQVGLVVGLDSDRPEYFERVGDFLDEARVQMLIASWLHYYPGTAPHEAVRREGRLLSEDWRDYDGNHPTIRPAGADLGQLREAVALLLRRFYGPRSIARRALHGGIAKDPAQLAHHLFFNAMMRSYYRVLETSWRDGERARARYMAPLPTDPLEDAAANATSWLVDRLLG
jgi:radical SAM superfamily enzyme YgiQ (UPF0313 family)